MLLVVLLFGVEASPCRAVRLRNRVRLGTEQPLISLVVLGRYDVELSSGVSISIEYFSSWNRLH